MSALIISVVIGLLLSALTFMGYYILTSNIPQTALLVSQGLYVATFVIYSVALYRFQSGGKTIAVRHQVVWPTVISIAIAVYYGKIFTLAAITIYSFVPVVTILGFLLLSELVAMSKKALIIASLSLFGFLLMAVALRDLSLIPPLTTPYYSFMIVLVPISAYLASFESWRITAWVTENAIFSLQEGDPIEVTKEVLQKETFRKGNPVNYYYATLSAMTLSILLIPFAYIFSSYANLFLLGFFVHSLISFSYWYRTGVDYNVLANSSWVIKKLVFGFTLLALLVLDTKLILPFDLSVLYKLVDLGSLAILITATLFPATRLWKNFNDIKEKNGDDAGRAFIELFCYRTSYIQMVAPISILFCAFILAVSGVQQSTDLQTKLGCAYAFYSFLIVLSVGTSIYLNAFSKDKISSVVSTAVGILLTTRVLTSSLICVSVVFPALYKGYDLLHSLAMSLPFVLSSMGGFALNDFFDYKKDIINEPTRAIPRNLISANTALLVGVLLLCLNFFTIINVARTSLEFYIYMYPLVGVIAYNYIVRHFTLLKNITTSIICVSPILFNVVALGFSDVYLLLPAAVLCFILGRELLMDIKDIPGDEESGITTFPLLVGVEWTERVSFVLQFVGVFLIVPMLGVDYQAEFVSLWFVLLALTLGSTALWYYKKGKHRPAVIKAMRFHMLIGVFMLMTSI